MYEWECVVEVDSGHERFNRAATRNLAVKWATINGFDIVVLNDADSVPEVGGMVAAINGAALDDLIHFPFNRVYELVPKATNFVGIQSPAILMNRAYAKCESEGGIWVMKPRVWQKAGYQDERFGGWGCEDRAFIAANHTLVGKPVKHDGSLFCMYHDRTSNESESWLPEEVELLIRYNDAYLNPEEMENIINERLNYLGAVAGTTEERSPTVRVLSGDLYRQYEIGDYL